MTTSRSGPAVRVEGLTKRYGERMAVDHLDVELPRGVVAGFIGPNGAGKTTTMAMLLGLVAPTSGTGTVLGEPLDAPARYLSRVGALIEGPALYPGLTGLENLRVLAAMGDRDPARIPAVLEQVGLADRAGDRFKEYSMGMKQRLGIAGALLGDPDLLVLDEPTNGLDPVGMREIRELIGELASAERTVLVSSHLLSEIEQVCDFLIVIEGGAGVFAGPAAEFVGGAEPTIAVAPEHVRDVELLARLLAAEGFDVERREDRLFVDAGGRDARALAVAVNRLAHEHGLVLAELEQHRANLQDRYLSLVEGGSR
ncbi:MAG: ATP-binding cassette domain-containing protein [Ilumatobacteraceae bacterium]